MKQMINSPGVLLSFDDYWVEHWLAAQKLFDEYNAVATFFVGKFEKFTQERKDGLLALQSSGHCIGCHGFGHKNAVESIKQLGAERYLSEEIIPAIDWMREIGIKEPELCFAYPSSARSEETDKVLFRIFRYLRSGVPQEQWDSVPIRIETIKPYQCFKSIGIDSNGGLNLQKVQQLLRRIKDENSIVIFYSHSIQDKSQTNYISTDKLKAILDYIVECDLPFYTFNDL